MAFPSSPTSGQIYKNYIYNSTDVSWKKQSDVSSGIGSIMMYSGSSLPTSDWMVCDGSLLNRTTYAALFAVIGTSYGVGNGSTTFNLPDLRETVPAGIGTWTAQTGQTTHTITAHDAYSLGQFKDDQFESHYHNPLTGATFALNNSSAAAGSGALGNVCLSNPTTGIPVTDGTNPLRTGTSTRTKQLGVNFIIKVR